MQKLLFNLHNHTNYCDGSSPPEAYIRAAIRKGFHTLGFSSHAPVLFQNKFAIKNEQSLLKYAAEIKALKIKYKNTLNVFLGLEIDYIPGISFGFQYYKILADLDYVIGGVHLVQSPEKNGLWFIDGSKQEIYDDGIKLLFDNDIRKAVISYWKQMREMITTQTLDIVAHLDKIKMHNKNRHFTENEPWYVEQLDQTLRLIAEKNIIVEVIPGGCIKVGRMNCFRETRH